MSTTLLCRHRSDIRLKVGLDCQEVHMSIIDEICCLFSLPAMSSSHQCGLLPLALLPDQLIGICREALLRYAGEPEEFFAMRKRYTANLAALCITGYVAGVGDRHLDNFLLHPPSGQLIPIDFGWAGPA